MMIISNGIIINPSNNPKIKCLPGKFNLENANAAKIVVKEHNDTLPTIAITEFLK